MRILLVQPKINSKMVGYTQMIRPEPLALEFVAASVMDKHEVMLIDQRVDESTLESTLESFKPQMVCTTGYTTDVPEMRRLLRKTKAFDKSIKTVIGGYHATLCPEDFDMAALDFIVAGEGEVTFRELVTAIEEKRDLSEVEGIIYRKNKEQITTPPRKQVKDLDTLPLAARQLTDRYRDKYHFHFWENPYVIETTRGCAHRCTFCSVWVFQHLTSRYRSPECIVNELKSLQGKTDMIIFVDDEFFQNPKRAEHMADLILAEGLKFRYWAQVRADDCVRNPGLVRKWRDAGMIAAFIGLEKISDEDLANVNKHSSVKINEGAIKVVQEDNGIDIWGSFIVDPQWGKHEFDALIDYIQQKKIAFPSFTVLTPLPGTVFFKEKVNELRTRNYEVFDLLHTVLPTKLPLDEFYQNLARLYASTTLGPKDLLRRVRSGQIPVSAIGRAGELLRDVTNPKAYLRSSHA